jgi:nicotinamidase-related amidase
MTEDRTAHPAPSLIQPDDTVLLVVDMQDKLLPTIDQADRCIQATTRIIKAGKCLGLPILLTEQYPAGLGRTCAALAELLTDVPLIEKTRFTACVEQVTAQLRALARPHVLVTGIEAHVCVQQTVLDLLRLGYSPYVCADGVSSRRPIDRDVAIQRMRHAGAVVTTTESAIFELLGQAGTDTFKEILKIVK